MRLKYPFALHPSSLVLCLLSLVLLTSCAPQQTFSTPRPLPLTPFLTSTSIPLPAPGGLTAPTTPLPSPTPFTYTIRTGDTLSEIAERFHVSLDDLLAANPQVSPNAMPVGQTLNIPGNPDNSTGEATPTPAPLTVEQIQCYPTADKGMWCFVLVRNDFSELIENVSAQIILVDSNGATVATQAAFLPLDILPLNTSLPLAAFFPPDVPLGAKPQAQILTAIQLPPGNTRYIPAAVNNTLVQVNADGYGAQVSGLVLSQSQTATANQIWVAATAYDGEGRVVGVRKWQADASLAPGGNLPFQFLISSVGGRIARVEFAVEAKP